MAVVISPIGWTGPLEGESAIEPGKFQVALVDGGSKTWSARTCDVGLIFDHIPLYIIRVTRTMNQARRLVIVGSTMVVLGLVLSSGCQSDRQTIFTAPRSGMKPIDSSVTARQPSAESELPSTRPVRVSNGVDVPILNPD